MGVDHGRFDILVAQELLDGADVVLGSAHFGWVTHVVEVDVALDPADVGLLCAIGVVFEADGIADLSNSFLRQCSCKPNSSA
jgi:hypothetical protein